MPLKPGIGQEISFATEIDEDRKWSNWHFVPVRSGDTVRKIAARYANPDDARRIADKNKIRSLTRKLRGPGVKPKNRLTRIQVPGNLRPSTSFHVLAGEQPPRIVGGYAKFSVVDRPERVGLLQFNGYDPITMEVPIQFEGWTGGGDGTGIERDISLLEEMAGRGNYAGAANGPSAIIRISVTDASGQIVPLVPLNYQWSDENVHAPVWRITNIDWDQDPLRHDNGNRLRQKATVTVMQHTTINLLSKSATSRAKAKKKSKSHLWAEKQGGFGNVPS
jgi:hypothetical protein